MFGDEVLGMTPEMIANRDRRIAAHEAVCDCPDPLAHEADERITALRDDVRAARTFIDNTVAPFLDAVIAAEREDDAETALDQLAIRARGDPPGPGWRNDPGAHVMSGFPRRLERSLEVLSEASGEWMWRGRVAGHEDTHHGFASEQEAWDAGIKWMARSTTRARSECARCGGGSHDVCGGCDLGPLETQEPARQPVPTPDDCGDCPYNPDGAVRCQCI